MLGNVESDKTLADRQTGSEQECSICPECGKPVTDHFGYRNRKGDLVHEDCQYVDGLKGEFGGFFRFIGLFQSS